MKRCWIIAVALLSAHSLAIARADEPSLKKYTPPTENKQDEPIAKQFSIDKAADFLDNAALHWTKKRGCFSCHTNFAYLYARPMLTANTVASWRYSPGTGGPRQQTVAHREAANGPPKSSRPRRPWRTTTRSQQKSCIP